MNTIKSKNPYVGPRPFTSEDSHLFFGRSIETRDLSSLVLGHNIIVLYGPSGAGKTSLINAGLSDLLRREWEAEILPATRVQGEIPAGVDASQIKNRFIYNAINTDEILAWAGDGIPTDLTKTSLAEFLSHKPRKELPEGVQQFRILIFDQLEELFTLYDDRWPDRKDFFDQINTALDDDPKLHIILSLREDYIAQLDRYVNILQDQYFTRYRLDLLKQDAALEAVTRPLETTPRYFEDEAAEILVSKLLEIPGIGEQKEGWTGVDTKEFVETVQLQVVCQTLWDGLEEDEYKISKGYIEKFDVDTALRQFYESSVEEVIKKGWIDEAKLRDWFDEKMITPIQTRGTVLLVEDKAAGIPAEVVEFLDREKHLLRIVPQRNARWVELNHDRLIDPILSSNQTWRSRIQAQQNARRDQVIKVLIIGFAAVVLSFIGMGLVQNRVLDARVDSTVTAKVTNLSQTETAVVYEQATAAKQTSESENAAFIGTATAERRAIETANAEATLNAKMTSTALVESQQTATAQVLANATATQVVIQQTAQAEAERQAQISLSRTLGAESLVALSQNFQRAMLLGVEAVNLFDPFYIRNTLLIGLSQVQMEKLAGHTGWIHSVAFSPDGSILATAGEDSEIILWDAETGQPMGDPLDLHTEGVTSVDFSPNGRYLASGSKDGQWILWDIDDRSQKYSVSLESIWIWDVKFSPDGKTLATASSNSLVQLWDVSNGEEIMSFDHEDTLTVYGVAWSPDGNLLASAAADRYVRLLDPQSERIVGILRGHSGSVKRVAWSPDGSTLASAGFDFTVILWDASDQKLIYRLEEHKGAVKDVRFSPDGRFLASAAEDHAIILWDVENGYPVFPPLVVHEHYVLGIDFRPENVYGSYVLASGSVDESAILWNLSLPLGITRLIPGHNDAVNGLDFSRDGKLFASGSSDGTVRLWGVGEDIKEFASFTQHAGRVLSTAFNPKGDILASGSDDRTIRLWDVTAKKQIGGPLAGHASTVSSVAFSPDGELLASGSRDTSVRLWDLDTQSPHGPPLYGHREWVNKVVFSPDGKLLASGGTDDLIILWDVATGLIENLLMGHSNDIDALAFSPDGRYLASGSTDKTVIVWEVATGSAFYILDGHTDWVSSLAFSPDGSFLASGSGDDTIRLWRLDTGTSLNMLGNGKGDIRALAFSPDGRMLLSGSDDPQITSWNFDFDAWRTLACSVAGRNLSLDEWNQYLGSDFPYNQTCPKFPQGENAMSMTPTPTSTPEP